MLLFFLMLFCAYSFADIGFAAEERDYVPGELLVKYKPSKQAAASAFYKTLMGISAIRDFNRIKVRQVKLPENISVEDALVMFRNDPDVEYVEPNYYRYLTATPNDADFNKQWGLQNTGQIVNEISGTADADIDADEAWNTSTGSPAVLVAVIDSGVDYDHPDLSANIWTNTGEIAGNDIDDDGNGYIDDVHGWDFFDNDEDPIDSNGHGTHVAGIIAAAGNNSIGVAGVSWTARIMPLRAIGALGYVSDIIGAVQYASDMGAHVINLSLGGPENSRFEKEAIDASPAVVVCAAGNNGTDNDVSHFYPSDYESANIISVAATDQNDNLASFSNYGRTSVDVAAPGVNIYSTIPARQRAWRDDFDDGDISDWIPGGTNSTWGATNRLSYSGSYSLADSPAGAYENDTNSWAISPAVGLSSCRGSKIDFLLRGSSEEGYDFLFVEVSTDLINWSRQETSLWVFPLTGSTGDEWLNVTADLGAFDGLDSVYVRFRLETDASNVEDGFYIDDIEVTAASSSHAGVVYTYLSGTSMAAPFVSGVAALILSLHPSFSNVEIKSRILDTVEIKEALIGKTATGGRLNAVHAFSNSTSVEQLLQTLPQGGGSGGICFIATAGSGSSTKLAEHGKLQTAVRSVLYPIAGIIRLASEINPVYLLALIILSMPAFIVTRPKRGREQKKGCSGIL